MTPFDRLLYSAFQSLRLAWYAGHNAVAMRLAPRIEAPPTPPLPSRTTIRADLEALFRQDWANVEDGLYPSPVGITTGPLEVAARSLEFLRDLAEVNRRRRERDTQEVSRRVPSGRYPRYYLRNFHFQSGGYLSHESARLYDHQVEVLFTGSADAMRRQALAMLARALRGRPQRQLNHLDIGCGTGRFLALVKNALPRLRVTGIDLSRAYLEAAALNLKPWSRTAFLEGNAETLPFANATFDSVSCLFLFHELPRGVRQIVVGEMARVLKSDGSAVFLDSIQLGDRPEYDALLERFPLAFHEPYCADYIRQDLPSLFAEAGLRTLETRCAFLAKGMLLGPDTLWQAT